ncbi:hypothetical protein FLONG3_11209 [Fusarium longipes]|uniref:DNA replication checkpoint mediator MRC1 domain-containing protein n=1 Tax=Fusarium longipes TaxID=694270 RepID=A0A395RH27_9HYPO|nr:hypothetical protein FLONG3_11209 [Fusarium longipes]
MATPSRASTPISSGGSPQPLSPNSRFKAQLAALDSSEDEESSVKKPRKDASTRHFDLPQQPTQHEDVSDESEEEIRPRGKFAARMQGNTLPAQPEGDSCSQRTTTRERVKMPKHEEKEAEQPEEHYNVDMPDISSEDDDTPVTRRRPARKASPAVGNTSIAPESGLFVESPVRPSALRSIPDNSDSDEDLPAVKTNGLAALAERYRAKNNAEESAKEAKRAEKRAERERLAQEAEQMASDDDSGITDDEGGRRLTQIDRPSARKASKKAIEEMNRETQRMSRNMQLRHEAKTRKKISKSSLFERFNFRPAGERESKIASSSRGPTPHSDVEMQDADTPPSSPPASKGTTGATEPVADDDLDLPTRDSLAETTKVKLDKGKEKATETPARQKQPAKMPKPQFHVRLPPGRTNMIMVDSDDELEITITPEDKIQAVFDMAQAKKTQKNSSVQTLPPLSHITSPGKEARRRNDNHLMTLGEMHVDLRQKIRQQTKEERDRRLDTLKAQGVVIQTAEERERQMQEVDDIVAKAREEARRIGQDERAAARKEKRENGEVDPLAWDDSDDEEYQASADEGDGEASAIELSGSEDEEDGEDGETEGSPMIEGEAEDGEPEASADEEDAAPITSQDVADDADELPVASKRRIRKPIVFSDDEEENLIEMTPKPKPQATLHTSPTVPNIESPTAPRSVLRSAKKNFIPGLPVQGAAGLGLTQIFAGTMDDSQVDAGNGPTQSMMPDFDHFPDSNFSATMDEPVEDMIMDSQRDDTQKTTQGVNLDFYQSQMRSLDSLLPEESTQLSDMIEFTQDEGLQHQTPLKERFVEAPVSTVETMVIGQEDPTQASPLVRRGRLRRRIDTPERIEETPEPSIAKKPNTAFDVLNIGAKQEKKKRAQAEFDHKNSKAKEMVQEQAEESEDEYAGLGGADGEDSDNESVASLKEIIDDAAGNDVDEAKLAAFYADRERAEDEKQVEKLFKDITTGMLRRKRGAGYDLDDSDDDGEARRKTKRRQFAKMQKALFADERVKKMAENPGNQAFLKTLEAMSSDDEMDFLDGPEETNEFSQSLSLSQSQDEEGSKTQIVSDSQPRKVLGLADNRAPAHLRRTKDGKKPSNIGEVRETLSDLLGEPQGSIIPATEAGSDSEGEEEAPAQARSDKENNGSNPRRGRVAVVDRISLKRNSSSNVSTSRLAFATTSSSSFKVPALLRRATANSFVSGTASTAGSGPSTPASGFGEQVKIKKGASKKSGIHSFARDSERRAKLEQSERRREERKVKEAERRVRVMSGMFDRGSFE